jgi:hypothetical protein
VVDRFAEAEDDFRHAVAEGAVMVNFGEANVFERHVPHFVKRGFDVGGAAADVFEEVPQIVFVHIPVE